jgi:hexosaminidase
MNSIYNLIPWPEKVAVIDGFLKFNDTIRIVLPKDADNAWMAVAHVFAEKLRQRFGITAEILFSPDEPVKGCSISIEYAKGPCQVFEGINPDEAYILSVGDMIRIISKSPPGLNNAFMTLLQLFIQNEKSAVVPKVNIHDRPRFSWRGTLIDPARNFLPVGTVKQYIDCISELKLNILHWHLVDDQGWRIESLLFPKLHQIGGKRGYYTQAQIREIIDYAAKRNVMLLPEIDMPGHTSAMLAAYPELSCSKKPVKIKQRPGIFNSALCVSNNAVYDFIDRLTGEVAGLFPFPYIHIGSDEVLAGDWLKHDECISLMERNGIKDKTGLHAHFVSRVNDILKKHGRKMIAWDEAAHFMPEGAVIQAWRNHKFAAAAAGMGHDAIVSPTTHCYYDYPHVITPVEKVYSFEPVPTELPENLTRHILGAEANLWGEWITPKRLTKRAFPRMLAHAEVCWSQKENRDYEHFKVRMKAVSGNMKKNGVRFGTRFEPLLLLWFGIMKLFDILIIRDKDKSSG